MSFLQGFKVLDLASVGPAARASRILADYGMEVIKVAPVSGKGQKQTEPVYHAYGAGRGTRRIRVDLRIRPRAATPSTGSRARATC